jgi:3-deoxy-manno-octulosonate cytidylyltransferase (CMP-KDO synthetase)
MNALAVIPARWASTRFPGKPVAPILGRPMIAWVVDAARAARSVDRVLVATDDERIAIVARAAGAEVRMTRADLATGTDRVAEAARGANAEVILNLQGDEPMLSPDAVDRLVAAFEDPGVRMATLARRGVTEYERSDPHVAKILVDRNGHAIYFSRGPIPYRNSPAAPTGVDRTAWKHVGTYGFRREALEEFASTRREAIEAAEDLEQLRALSLGWKIQIVEVFEEPVCVDRPEDVNRVEELLRTRSGRVPR